MAIFEGSGVAIVTPFFQDETIDYDAYQTLLDFHLEHQTDAIIVSGTTGESPTLTDDEKVKLFELTVKHVDGRIPVIAGTGSNNTAKAIEMSQRAETAGVDALLVVTPYYNKATEAGMMAHFTAIADAVQIPIILYHVPGRTGASLSAEQVAQLAKHPRIVAIKDAVGDLTYTQALKDLVPDDFTIYSGNDDMIYDMMAIGAKGVISVLANVAPQETHHICHAYLAGDHEQAQQLQTKFNPLVAALFAEVNPVPVKYLSHLLGFHQAVYRLPMCPPSEPVCQLLAGYLDQLKHYQV